MRPAALITGASSGIGEQLARQLAESGHDLFLVARTQARLEALAVELRLRHRVEVKVHAEDLGTVGAAARVVAALDESGLDLAVLVNNAGFGLHSVFAESDLDGELGMVMVNVVALQQLTRLVLPRLLRREGGHVLNVGSTAGLQPIPYFATYAATKAFVVSFSQALADELRDSGVGVTVLCPGPTATRFADTAGASELKLFTAQQSRADDVARIGLAAMHHRKPLVIVGAKNRLLAWGARFVPRALIMRISRGLMHRQPALPAR